MNLLVENNYTHYPLEKSRDILPIGVVFLNLIWEKIILLVNV